MKITFNKKDFIAAIAIGGSYAGMRKALPMLEDVKFTYRNGKMYMMSYDERNAIKTECSVVSCDEEGQFCIKKVDIERYVSLVRSETFEIEITEEVLDERGVNKRINATVKADGNTMVFPCNDPQFYPTIKNVTDGKEVAIPSNQLGYWLETCPPFLNPDSEALVSNSTHLIIEEKKVNIFAYHNDKAYHDSFELDTDIEDTISINMASFSGVLKAIKGIDSITIQNGSNGVKINAGCTTLLLRKEEGNIPKFFQLLKFPKKFSITISKSTLVNVLKKCLLIEEGKLPVNATFVFSSTGIEITCEEKLSGKSMKDFIECEGGMPLSVTYRPRLMLLAIDGINSDNIILSPTGDTSLLYINNPDYETELTMIMPCQKN